MDNVINIVSTGTNGPVSITMNVDGAVIHCRVHPHWRRRLAGNDLGTAVVSVIQQAHWLILQQAERDGPPSAPAHSTSRASRTPEPADPAEFTSYLWTLLNDVQNSLPQVAASVLRTAHEVSTVEGAGGAVVATIRAGALVQLRCQPTWLRRTGHEAMGHVLTDVLSRALPGSMRRMLAEVDAVGRVREFRELMADPARLLTAMGLGERGLP